MFSCLGKCLFLKNEKNCQQTMAKRLSERKKNGELMSAYSESLSVRIRRFPVAENEFLHLASAPPEMKTETVLYDKRLAKK